MPRQNRFNDTLYNPDWLRRVYVDEGRNASQVAALVRCTPGAVLDALRRYGIEVKPMSEVIKALPHEGSHAPRPRAEFKNTLHNPAWLFEHFVTKHLNASEIAHLAGCSPTRAGEAIKDTFGLDTTVRTTESEEVRHERRGRATARRLHPSAQPCIVCGRKGTLNHIDANPHNNEPVNLEWLCMRHHLMVDKRLQAKAARWLREQRREMWLQWHDEILAEVHANPDTPTRKHYHFSKDPDDR